MLRRTRRHAAALVVLSFVAAGAALAAPGPRKLASVQALETGVLVQVNALRAESALAPLRWSSALAKAARAHSLEMVEAGYFGHASSDGTAFWRRIARFYRPRRPQGWAVGENLLWSARGVGPQGALRLWLRSPEHRANLLDPRWREVGIAAVRAMGAPGVFGGRSVVVVTVDFGVR